jgi:hypothetical protein
MNASDWDDVLTINCSVPASKSQVSQQTYISKSIQYDSIHLPGQPTISIGSINNSSKRKVTFSPNIAISNSSSSPVASSLIPTQNHQFGNKHSHKGIAHHLPAQDQSLLPAISSTSSAANSIMLSTPTSSSSMPSSLSSQSPSSITNSYTSRPSTSSISMSSPSSIFLPNSSSFQNMTDETRRSNTLQSAIANTNKENQDVRSRFPLSTTVNTAGFTNTTNAVNSTYTSSTTANVHNTAPIQSTNNHSNSQSKFKSKPNRPSLSAQLAMFGQKQDQLLGSLRSLNIKSNAVRSNGTNNAYNLATQSSPSSSSTSSSPCYNSILPSNGMGSTSSSIIQSLPSFSNILSSTIALTSASAKSSSSSSSSPSSPPSFAAELSVSTRSLQVGDLSSKYPSPVHFYSDHCTYNFHHPFMNLVVDMEMHYKDMQDIIVNVKKKVFQFKINHNLIQFGKDYLPQSNRDHCLKIELNSETDILKLKQLSKTFMRS